MGLQVYFRFVLQFFYKQIMHPGFNSEFVGLDWQILFVGHIIMIISLALRFDWSWIALTEHEKLCGVKGNQYRDQLRLLEKTFLNS